MRKNSTVLIAALALIVGIGAGHFGPRLFENKPPVVVARETGAGRTQGRAAGGAAIAVEVTAVRRLPLERAITAVGSLRSDESAVLKSEVPGRISHIGFIEGQRVQKGQVLFRLDDSVPRAELQQARANHSLAKSNFDRSIELQNRGFISKQARDEADNAMKVQEAAMVLAQVKLDKSEIRAPFGGMVGLRSVSVGDYVGIGQELVPLEAIDPLKVDFRIPELHLAQAHTGQLLQITLDAMPGKTYSGTVFAISPLIDAGGRSIVMRARVKNDAAQLRPGMFARIRLLLAGQADALMIPEAALMPEGDNHFVYRVDDERAVRVKVDVGQRRDGLVEVVGGLDEGQTIVVAGMQKIRHGSAVKTTPQAAES